MSEIALHELPARMRMMADDMEAVGIALRYFGGFGPLAEWGEMLEKQSAVMSREIAAKLEEVQGGRA